MKWEDQFGIWHLAIPRGTPNPHDVARQALIDEVTERDSTVNPATINVAFARVDRMTGDIIYREVPR